LSHSASGDLEITPEIVEHGAIYLPAPCPIEAAAPRGGVEAVE
jgi:hypothetical protein